jgi:hypothetical protein
MAGQPDAAAGDGEHDREQERTKRGFHVILTEIF